MLFVCCRDDEVYGEDWKHEKLSNCSFGGSHSFHVWSRTALGKRLRDDNMRSMPDSIVNSRK